MSGFSFSNPTSGATAPNQQPFGLSTGSTTLGGVAGLGNSTTSSLGQPSLTTNVLSQQSTSAVTAPAPQTTLTFRVLEDYINKWMSELDGQEKEFINQAVQLNALDKLMIENGEKIVDLNNEVDRLTSEQEQLEQELDFINSQQNDLEGTLKKLEDDIEKMPLNLQQRTDTSRIEMYKLLIEVDNQLRGMSTDLKEVINRLNDTNVDLNDPTTQISKILNAHMDSLNWIEYNTNYIQKEMDKFSKIIDENSKENIMKFY